MLGASTNWTFSVVLKALSPSSLAPGMWTHLLHLRWARRWFMGNCLLSTNKQTNQDFIQNPTQTSDLETGNSCYTCKESELTSSKYWELPFRLPGWTFTVAVTSGMLLNAGLEWELDLVNIWNKLKFVKAKSGSLPPEMLKWKTSSKIPPSDTFKQLHINDLLCSKHSDAGILTMLKVGFFY